MRRKICLVVALSAAFTAGKLFAVESSKASKQVPLDWLSKWTRPPVEESSASQVGLPGDAFELIAIEIVEPQKRATRGSASGPDLDDSLLVLTEARAEWKESDVEFAEEAALLRLEESDLRRRWSEGLTPQRAFLERMKSRHATEIGRHAKECGKTFDVPPDGPAYDRCVDSNVFLRDQSSRLAKAARDYQSGVGHLASAVEDLKSRAQGHADAVRTFEAWGGRITSCEAMVAPCRGKKRGAPACEKLHACAEDIYFSSSGAQ